MVVAYDSRNNRYKPVYSMGRHNHENAVAIVEDIAYDKNTPNVVRLPP